MANEKERAHYTSWQPPWEPLSLVLTVGAVWLTARGVRLSTMAVGLAVLVQVAIMLLVCVVVLVGVWWAIHLIGVDTGSMNPVGLYAECSTMGTIVILFVYFLTTLALPVFMWRRHRRSFSALRHIAIPVLGALTLVVPFVELCKPGQPAPYSEFPYVALAIMAVATAIACVVVHRHPATGAGEGTAFTEP